MEQPQQRSLRSGYRRIRSGRGTAALLSGSLILLGCEALPRDPGGTLANAAGGTLRVGVSEAPPLLTRMGAAPTGPEAELVESFARSIGARVDWRWGPLDQHLEALERRELDVVVGGLREGSPWKTRVAFTRPWRRVDDTAHVVAVPPGENRTLVHLERLIEARKRSVAR